MGLEIIGGVLLQDEQRSPHLSGAEAETDHVIPMWIWNGRGVTAIPNAVDPQEVP